MNTSKKQTDLLKEAVITAVHRTEYVCECDGKTIHLVLAGRFQYLTFDKSDYPVVGDKVMVRIVDEHTGVIESVCARKNVLMRAGVSPSSDAQILAANIDIIFVCMAMDKDFNMKKLQNFLSLTYDVGAKTVILLTKKDVTENQEAYINQVKSTHKEEIQTISVYDEEDIEALEHYIGLDTAVFIGSSGVGKSSLINALLKEERFKVNDVRESDAQGRHTTTHRELIHLPSGGVVIDTPGIRVVYSHFVDDVDDAFEEVIAISETCKFRDCKHENEPGCAVKKALKNDELTEERFEAYKKILKLNKYHQKRDNERKRLMEKKNAYPKSG